MSKITSKSLPWIFSLTALLLVSLSPGCGGSGSDTNSNVTDHQIKLLSISVMPASADAQNFPNGTVQFVDSLQFSNPDNLPILVSPVTWCIAKSTGTCAGTNDVMGATIYGDVSGPGVLNGTGVFAVAQCSPGFTGQVTILAGSTPAGVSMAVANPPGFDKFGSVR